MEDCELPQNGWRRRAIGCCSVHRTDFGLIGTRAWCERDAGARYHGVTHEYLDVPGDVKELHGVWYKDHASGSNRVDKFERDIKFFSESARAGAGEQPATGSISRNPIATPGAREAAESLCQARGDGRLGEEAWKARLQEARCLRSSATKGVPEQALAAFNQRPQRAEPLYDLARFYREKGMNDASVLFSEAGLAMKCRNRTSCSWRTLSTRGTKRRIFDRSQLCARPRAQGSRFAACNWLATNRAIPDGPRVSRGRTFFYLEPASTMMPSFARAPSRFIPRPEATGQ